jgi:hypothetical protein
MINLGLMRKDAIASIERIIFSVGQTDDWKKFHEDSKTLCNDFLILAASSLLCDVKPASFFLYLARCAENWRRFISYSQSNYAVQASLYYNEPFYAATICLDKQLLVKLLSVMPKDWQKGRGSKTGCFGFQLTIFCPPLHSQHQCSSIFKECGI